MRNVPKLRFKEFTDEWEEKKLEDVSDVRDGTHDSPKYVDKGYPLVTSKNVQNGKIDLENVNYISLEDFEMINKRSKVSKGDILMGMIGTIGNLAIVDKDDFAIKNVALIKEKNVLKNSVLYQILQSNIFYKKLSLLNEGGTQKFISLGNIRNLNFNIPGFNEQEKIADFLSSIDKKISITEEKFNLFTEYKKGIMQKIFNQELRFKDENGNDYPEWEEKRLGEILDEYIEKTTINNQYPTISSTATGIYLQEEYFNRQIASSNNVGYKILNKNQLVLSPQNLWLGNININFKYEIGIVSPSYKIFNINESLILIKYLNNLLKTNEMLFKYKNASEQGASVVRRNLDMNQFFEINIDIPCLEEQQKIADFLSAIDTKIEKISDELNNLKEFKKGLLQQMFV